MTTFPCDAVTYEGPGSKNPLSFKHYNADEIVAGKTMAEWFRFGCAYWHTMRGTGSDPFGVGTAAHPWDDGTDSVANAQNRARVFFDFMQKVGLDYYCFHDRDVAPEMGNLAASQQGARCRRRRARRRAEAHRQETPLGHRLPLRPSALSARCRHQPERPGLRLSPPRR